MTTLFDLEDITEEWPELFEVYACRDCGGKVGGAIGGARAAGIFYLCDACASLDGCGTRESATPGYHLSRWGETHPESLHERLVQEREKRRAAYRRRAAA